MNVKKFKVRIEQEIEITLNMDIYTKDIIQQVKDYWGFEKDEEDGEFFIDLIDFIVCKYLQNGYFDPDIEGVAINGHRGRLQDVYIDIKEQKVSD